MRSTAPQRRDTSRQRISTLVKARTETANRYLQDVIVINVRTLDRKEHLIAHSVTLWYVLPKVSMWKFIHSGNGAVHHNSIVASSTVKTTYNRTFIPGILYVINIMTRAQRSIKLTDFYVLNYLRIQ